MAETVGILKVQIDAEPGAALEHLARLETELEAVRQERDEAREVARELYHHPSRHRELWYRWLKEEE